MGCESCGTGTSGLLPVGCNNNGTCSTGGCNKLNVLDWFADIPLPAEQERFKIVEISFNNGSRKGFCRNSKNLPIETGDIVIVETLSGQDTGMVSLCGELVRLQMKKKKVEENDENIMSILRIANEKDIEIWQEARALVRSTLVKARKIARDMKLDMKIGDVEYQGDKKKAIFYFTADERVDFRELIKAYANEFKVKIEMWQIGLRQEAGKLGGIGDCGRELCCSTWLTDFKTVSTTAARYQHLAINQAKLSGQCGRLKCCLNYELDTYLDALKEFPQDAQIIQTEKGPATLQKTDIFKRLMYYSYEKEDKLYPFSVEQVNKILEMNKREGKNIEH